MLRYQIITGTDRNQRVFCLFCFYFANHKVAHDNEDILILLSAPHANV